MGGKLDTLKKRNVSCYSPSNNSELCCVKTRTEEFLLKFQKKYVKRRQE